MSWMSGKYQPGEVPVVVALLIILGMAGASIVILLTLALLS